MKGRDFKTLVAQIEDDADVHIPGPTYDDASWVYYESARVEFDLVVGGYTVTGADPKETSDAPTR